MNLDVSFRGDPEPPERVLEFFGSANSPGDANE